MKGARRRPPRVLERRIGARLGAVESLGQEVREFLQGHGLEAAAFPVELTAREGLNNAVSHGKGRRRGGRVGFDLRIGSRWIRLRVKDGGKGFNWRGWRRARLQASHLPHGRGLMIYQRYAQRVAFNQSGNQITLWLPKTRKQD
jgi:anti-sigma regulatory factor (Ser/Thr protein kinase)